MKFARSIDGKRFGKNKQVKRLSNQSKNKKSENLQFLRKKYSFLGKTACDSTTQRHRKLFALI